MRADPAWRNKIGKPLSDPHWLAVHHQAKIRERTAFAQRLAGLAPKRIVDLGCGAGDWLSTLDTVVHKNCEFIGVDVDTSAMEYARDRLRGRSRSVNFLTFDFTLEPERIPPSDLVLLFNMGSFIDEFEALLSQLHSVVSGATVAVRQYDGSTIRIGPMRDSQRTLFENSLRASLKASKQFDHYALDRTLVAISASPYRHKQMEFETFSRFSPFSHEEQTYIELTLDWIYDHLSEDGRREFNKWRCDLAVLPTDSRSYVCEIDLVALLS